MLAASEDNGITLPYLGVPEFGEARQILPPISWVRLPLPFRLNHVNIWFLKESDGWTGIDCGLDTPQTRQIWEYLIDGLLDRKLKRVIATHGHTDHIGLAGYLVNQFGVSFYATLAEWCIASLRFHEREQTFSKPYSLFHKMHGCDDTLITTIEADRRRIMTCLGVQPTSNIRIRDGDQITLGGHIWRVITAGGHSPEHASLYCEDLKVLIAGDQILERISPIIGVYLDEPEADPLSEYLTSLSKFAALPPDVLVLPSHGQPFFGLHIRINQLIHHHQRRLETLANFLTDPKTATNAAMHLFGRDITEDQGFLALAETLAHLHRLVSFGCVDKILNAAGQIAFQRNASPFPTLVDLSTYPR